MTEQEIIELRKSKAKKSFVEEILGDWYECCPYGEQVPDELPRLLTEFSKRHGELDELGMCEAIAKADADDPLLGVVECLFKAAASFTISRLADAVFDRDKERLSHIDLEPIGVLANANNDPNPECKHQHVMHSDEGGRMLFAELGGGGAELGDENRGTKEGEAPNEKALRPADEGGSNGR